MLDREPGFIYRFLHLRRNALGILVPISDETIHNLMPYEGLNHMLATEFAAGEQVSAWYVALFSGDYTPTRDITGATFAETATECTAYSTTTRPAWTPGAAASGQIDNSTSMASFTFTADATVYGAAIVSTSAKGDAAGVLASIVRSGSAKSVSEGDVLQVIVQQGFVISD